MSEQNFRRLLRTAEEHALKTAPTRHSRRTDACPSLAVLTEQHYRGLSPELQQHLETCDHCRSLQRKLVALDRRDQALAALLFIAARQSLRRLHRASRYGSTAVELPEQRLEFEDPDLAGVLLGESDGKHWLDLTHARHPSGTLLRVRIQGGGEPDWNRFIVLRPSLDKPLARLCVESALQGGERELSVAVVSAGDLTTEDASLLRTSLEAARTEDPRSLPAWKEWAQAALAGPALAEEVRAVLDEMMT
jgi:hypothetical protein